MSWRDRLRGKTVDAAPAAPPTTPAALDADDARSRAAGTMPTVALVAREQLPHDPAQIVSVSVGPSGELIVATSTADPILTHAARYVTQGLAGSVGPQATRSYTLDIHTHGSDRPTVQAENVTLAYPTVQPVPGGGHLVVGARASWHDERAEPNAVVLDANGFKVRGFCIGDGVQHVHVDHAGTIWVGYTDEGIYGNYGWGPPTGPTPLGASGLARWTLEGRKEWGFRRPADVPPIDDCYAMNLAGDTVWTSYYSDFPIVSVAPNGAVTALPSLGSGARALVVSDRRIGIIGGYRELADRLVVAGLDRNNRRSQQRRAFQIVLPDGSPLPPDAEIVARGSTLHTVLGGVWMSLDLDAVG